jgi:hypothetical protein
MSKSHVSSFSTRLSDIRYNVHMLTLSEKYKTPFQDTRLYRLLLHSNI